MAVNYGASRVEWEAFSQLTLQDLLPYVADPNVPTHPHSRVKSGNKTPSFVMDNSAGFGAMGFLKWTDPAQRTTSMHDWWEDPRLGIGMIGRKYKAIDIDVPDRGAAIEIEAFIRETLGIPGLQMPLRDRADSGKRLMLYRLTDNEAINLYRVPIDRNLGMIEFLGDKQYIALCGGHPDGGRYRWTEGIPTPDDVPEFELGEIIDLTRQLIDVFAPKGWYREWRYKSEYTARSYHADTFDDNPAVKYLIDNDWFVDYTVNGGVYVRCPWAHFHGTEGNLTEAEFFPAGSNQRDEHGFKCMHAHSLAPGGAFSPNATEFLHNIGFQSQDTAAEFKSLAPVATNEADTKPAPAETRPKFTYKGKTGRIEATLSNSMLMLNWTAGTEYYLCYDQFKDSILYRNGSSATWMQLTDNTYTEIRLRMSYIGMEDAISKDMVRDAINLVAERNSFDSAQEWLKSKQWDGVQRIDHFHTRVLGLGDTPYHRAVCRYLWTAMAGRVLDPGCKADMIPILTGKQGLRKSSLVEALAPTKDEYTVVTLADRDENLARQLRGRMVAEWDELRGLNSRDAEALKGWVTRTKDDWVPKFKEFATTLLRRFMLIGTGNPKRYLNDPTGLRRWLPLFITHVIDVDYVLLYRDQLWAEARVLWEARYTETAGYTGVLWEDAERLSAAAQQQASIRDPWVDAVSIWLRQQDQPGSYTTLQILHQACSISTAQISFGTQERLRRTMAYLDWEEDEEGRWCFTLA